MNDFVEWRPFGYRVVQRLDFKNIQYLTGRMQTISCYGLMILIFNPGRRRKEPSEKKHSNAKSWAVWLTVSPCQNIEVMKKIGLSVYCENMYRMRKGYCPSKCVRIFFFQFVNVAASLTENLLWGIERVVSAIFIPFLNSKVDHICSLIIINYQSSIVDEIVIWCPKARGALCK